MTISQMSQTEEVTSGAGGAMPRPPAHPYLDNIELRQRARELVARNRRTIAEIEDILLFDIQCAKQWRDARRGVWS
jgi:hypothetical protein